MQARLEVDNMSERPANRKMIIGLVLVAHLCAASLPGTAAAMTCIAPHGSFDDALSEAEFVFVGQLAEATYSHRKTVVTGRFDIHEVIKGPRIDDHWFETMVRPKTDCGIFVDKGGRYLVFANSGPVSLLILPDTTQLEGNEAAEQWLKLHLTD